MPESRRKSQAVRRAKTPVAGLGRKRPGGTLRAVVEPATRHRYGRMNWVDFTFIAIVIVSLLFGVIRGLIREVLSLVTWVLAFVIALRYGPDVAVWLKPSVTGETLRGIIGYVLCFFGVLLVGALVTLVASLVIRRSPLSAVDRTLGAGFGLLRGALIVVGLVMTVGASAMKGEVWWRQSQLVPTLKPAADQLQALIPEQWLAYWRPHESPSQPRNGLHPITPSPPR